MARLSLDKMAIVSRMKVFFFLFFLVNCTQDIFGVIFAFASPYHYHCKDDLYNQCDNNTLLFLQQKPDHWS